MFHTIFKPLIRPFISPFIHQTIRNKIYLPTHEWLTDADDEGIIKMGISEKAGKELGEVTFIDYLVEPETIIEKDEELVIIESVKAVSSIQAHANCEVIEINKEFENNLDGINKNPECEEKSWILKLKNLE